MSYTKVIPTSTKSYSLPYPSKETKTEPLITFSLPPKHSDIIEISEKS
mgnify:CR=1 FL=1